MANAGTLLEERALPRDGDELVLRREIQASGKGRATVNGAIVPLAAAARPGPAPRRGARPARAAGPARSGDAPVARRPLRRSERRGGGRALPRAARGRGGARAAARRRARGERRREMLEFQALEIENAELRAGEEEALRAEKARQANAGRLASLSSEAYALLYDDEARGAHAARARLQARRGAGRDRRRVPPVPGGEGRLPAAARGPGARAARLPRAAGGEPRPARRDRVAPGARRAAQEEVRLVASRRCWRSAPAAGASSRRSLSPEQEERAASRSGASARPPTTSTRARALSKRRRSIARELVRRVQAELAELAMEKTRFEVLFTPADAERRHRPSGVDRAGLERAEFLLSPNPGEELRPLARIASGGELSRLMLVLKSRGARRRGRRHAVFDEVDAGIGGARGRGRRAEAAEARRPQPGALRHPPAADRRASPTATSSSARRWRAAEPTYERRTRLSDGERVEEVARMMAGETITSRASTRRRC